MKHGPSPPAEHLLGDVDGGQRWTEEGSDRDVVEADNRQIPRDADVRLAQAGERADRHEVVQGNTSSDPAVQRVGQCGIPVGDDLLPVELGNEFDNISTLTAPSTTRSSRRSRRRSTRARPVSS